MTDRKITFALKKIRSSKDAGYPLECLIRSYHLNVEIIKYILSVAKPDFEISDKKIKVLVKTFLKEISAHPELKSIINKKSVKSLKPWLSKMEVFFKAIKISSPKNVVELQLESEKIYGILKISANKLFIKGKA